MILLLSLILLGCYCFHLWETYSYWRRRGVVGPTPWPIVGNYGQVLFRFKSEDKLIRELYDQYPDEKFIGIFVGRTPALIVKDLEMVKQVLSKDFKYFPDRLTSVTSIAFTQSKNGVFVSPGNDKWFKNRKFFIGLSNNNKMTKMLETIQDTSTKYLDYIEERVSVTPKQNICKLQEDLFFVISSDAILGTKLYTSYDKTSELQKRTLNFAKNEIIEFRYCLELLFPQLFHVFRYILQAFPWYFLNPNLTLSHSALIQSRNTKLEDNIKGSFTDIILQSQEEKKQNNGFLLNDDSLAIHLTASFTTLVMPGSNIASCVYYELAQNSDIQNKCYEEVTEVLKKFDGTLTLESMKEMKYLNMVIEETFRKYGTTVIINRSCISKYRFPDTTVEVDPGVIIFTPANAIRHDPKYFDEPEKFIPERHSPENKDKIDKCANLAFGYGNRQCTSKPMSKQIIFMNVALFLRRFKIEPTEQTPGKITFDPRYIVRIPNVEDFWMNIMRRK